MNLSIRQETAAQLPLYAQIPIAFMVHRILEVVPEGLSGIKLVERDISLPYLKDYDALAGEGPLQWAKCIDVRYWSFWGAYQGEKRVGGAAVAFKTEGLGLLEGRQDLALLWDLRVAPRARRQGVGVALFQAVEGWARAQGCRQLKVETQNVNLPACRFYAQQGCHLGGIWRFAYPDLPEESQLLWYKTL